MSESQLATQEKELVEYIPFGADEKIKLSLSIVQNLIAVPTRSGKLPSKNDSLKFMMLCRARHLDPFSGDAFLIGYDTQNGPAFSLITAHQVFLKRAEASEKFDGMESGVVVTNKDGTLIERETDFVLKGETLLGGWARVFRKDRTKPFYRRLNLETFDTGLSRWKKDAAGMIVKCAEADALRSAFPTHLGGLHLSQEIQDVQSTVSRIPEARVGMKALEGDRPQPIPSITEMAAEEKQREDFQKTSVDEVQHTGATEVKDVKTPCEVPVAGESTEGPMSTGPSPAMLKADIMKQARKLSVGQKGLEAKLFDFGYTRNSDTLDSLDANALATILDSWAEIADRITNPNAA